MSTTNTPTTSVFETLGYQVASRERGIYVLRNRANPAAPEAVALLLTAHPPEAPVLPVKLFVQPVPRGVDTRTITDLWDGLDARRFEESGLDAATLELGPLDASDLEEQAYGRPEGGKRFGVRLPSGDVVCFN